MWLGSPWVEWEIHRGWSGTHGSEIQSASLNRTSHYRVSPKTTILIFGLLWTHWISPNKYKFIFVLKIAYYFPQLRVKKIASFSDIWFGKSSLLWKSTSLVQMSFWFTETADSQLLKAAYWAGEAASAARDATLPCNSQSFESQAKTTNSCSSWNM